MIPRIEYEFTTHTCSVQLAEWNQKTQDQTLADLVNDRWEIVNMTVCGSPADDQAYDLIRVTTLKRRVVEGLVLTQSGRDRIQLVANDVAAAHDGSGDGAGGDQNYFAALESFYLITKREMGLK